MHVPDHYLDPTTSAATGLVAAAAITLSVVQARRQFAADPDGPSPWARAGLAGAVTAVIFAGQMVNFPVASGTSGHLMGAALATALLGPWLGLLSITTVLVAQALLFADGGLSALGTNTLLMGVVGVAVAVGVTRLASRWSTTATRRALTAGAAAVVSVPVAAAVFAGLYAVGGNGVVPLGELLASMVGVHALIGVGEGVWTVAVVAAVAALAPALVGMGTGDARLGAVRIGDRAGVPAVIAGGGAVAAVLAVAVARFASPHPDGLEFVASRLGFDVTGGAHALGGSLLADYGAVHGVDVGLAGIVGVIAVAVAMAAVVRLVASADRTVPSAAV